MADSKPRPVEARGKVAALYSRARIADLGYRDFSASRSDARARFRRQMLRKEEELARAAIERTAAQEAREEAAAIPKEGAPAETISAPAPQPQPPPSPAEYLEDPAGQAKERAPSRWFALEGLFAQAAPSPALAADRERRVPVAAVFSLAGGVGKTSLVATLGRVLAGRGERVLLAGAADPELLPFYFGARDIRPGVVRMFTAPGKSIDVPVEAVTLATELSRAEVGRPDPLIEELLRDGRRSNRILVDVQTASEALARKLIPLAPTVLALLLPEMSSVVSVAAIEAVFSGSGLMLRQNSAPRNLVRQKIEPVYLLNQFDPSLPLHAAVREVLGEQLGDRLLPFVIHRSPAVSEALAEGMTVVDYAPDSSIVEDYVQLADWLRKISPAAADYGEARWSER